MLAVGWVATSAAVDEPLPEVEYLLVEIRLNGYRLPDFEDALHGTDGNLWLPLEPLVRAAEGDLTAVEPGVFRIALGETIAVVGIDTTARQLRVDGNLRDWPEDEVVLENGQLFLGQDLLQSLLGLDAVLSEDGLRVDVDSERPLPADLRRLRERRWQRFGRSSIETEHLHRELYRPYVLWGNPRGDLRFSANNNRSDTRLRNNASGVVEVEAGYLSNRFFFSGNEQDGLRSLRWTGGRTSPEGKAFGIPGLYRLEAGDVSAFRLPLLGSGGSGRGVRFSTAPLSRPDLFDVIRIEGDALPGWDAELYRGSELIDFQRIGDDGRYDFDDVPLGFGANAFRVVLYGPQGQIQEREIRQPIPGGQLLPGELHLRGGLVQTGRPVVSLDNREQRTGEQFTLRADYGLLPRLTGSLLLGADREPWSRLGRQQPGAPNSLDSEPSLSRQHAGISLRPALGTLRSEWVVLQQDGGATAAQADAGFAFQETSVSANYRLYDGDFISRDRLVGGRLFDDRLRLRVGRGLGELGGVGLGSLTLRYDRYALSQGGTREEYRPRWRHRVGPVSVSHELDHVRQLSAASTSYRLLGSYRHGPLTSRTQLRASGRQPDDLSVSTVSGSLDYRLGDERTVGGSVTYGVASGTYSLNARLNQQLQLPAGQIGVSASSNDRGQWSAGLSLTLGLGMDRPPALSLMPPGHAGAGAVALDVFEDWAADGQFDPDQDRPLADVGFLVDGRPHPAVTDDAGQVVLRPLATDRPVRIALDPDSMEDPFLTSVSSRLRLQPRPGFTHQVSMPLVDSALVTGTVAQNGRPLAGVVVTARRTDGRAEETTRSLSDGYFSFETLSPGEWAFEVDSEDLPDGWASTAPSRTLEPGGVYDGVTISATPPSAEEGSRQ